MNVLCANLKMCPRHKDTVIMSIRCAKVKKLPIATSRKGAAKRACEIRPRTKAMQMVVVKVAWREV